MTQGARSNVVQMVQSFGRRSLLRRPKDGPYADLLSMQLNRLAKHQARGGSCTVFLLKSKPTTEYRAHSKIFISRRYQVCSNLDFLCTYVVRVAKQIYTIKGQPNYSVGPCHRSEKRWHVGSFAQKSDVLSITALLLRCFNITGRNH